MLINHEGGKGEKGSGEKGSGAFYSWFGSHVPFPDVSKREKRGQERKGVRGEKRGQGERKGVRSLLFLREKGSGAFYSWFGSHVPFPDVSKRGCNDAIQ